MKKAERDKLERTFNSYFEEIHKIYMAGGFRKASLNENVGISNRSLSGNGEIFEGQKRAEATSGRD
jgi:hypothetical protein